MEYKNALIIAVIILLASSLAYAEAQQELEVDQILFKVLVKSPGSIERQLKITNHGEKKSVNIEIAGISDVASVYPSSLEIEAGGQSVVNVSFFSSGKTPGVYTGRIIVRSEDSKVEIPAIVEVESKDALLDMNLNPISEKRISQGQDAVIEVRLFNLLSIDSINADVNYYVKDMENNVIISESETVVVKSQASFFKTVTMPSNMRPDSYVFAAEAKFRDSVGTSSYTFEVIEKENRILEFCSNGRCNDYPLYGAFIISIILILHFAARGFRGEKDTLGKRIVAGIFSGIARWHEARQQRKERIWRQKEQARRQKEIEETERKKIKEHLESKFLNLQNKVHALKSRLGSIEHEKKKAEEGIKEAEKNIEDAKNEIMGKNEIIQEQNKLRKNSIAEYNSRIAELKQGLKQEEDGARIKLKELLQQLREKEVEMEKNLAQELKGLKLSERKRVEKWKRMKIKAELKIEQEKIMGSIPKPHSLEKIKQFEQEHKESMKNVREREMVLQNEIVELSRKISDIESEKSSGEKRMRQIENAYRELQGKISDAEQELKGIGNQTPYRPEKKALFEKASGKGDEEIRGAQKKLKEKIARKKPRPKEDVADALLKAKSKAFEKCRRIINEARKTAIQTRASMLYMEARDIYEKLDYFEKKELYHELKSLYEKLKGKNAGSD